MRGARAFLAAALAAAPCRGAEEALMARAVEAYRAGRLSDALVDMTRVLEADPENATAKNYVWTLSKRIRERRAAAAPTESEKRQAVALALKHLERRRAAAQASLADLRRAYERSEDLRGPEDILLDVDGMDRYLGADFEDERRREQAQAYFGRIMTNLGEALNKGAFVSRKDQLNALAYLAYYNREWGKALDHWEKAALEDPGDAAVQKSLAHVRKLVAREKQAARLRLLTEQAEAYQKTGYHAEAAEAWKEVLSLTPDDAAARAGLMMCKIKLQEKQKAAKVESLTSQGVAHYRAGRYAEGVDLWLKALQVDPGHKEARVWLGLVGKQLQSARGPASAAKPEPAAGPAATRSSARNVEAAERMYREGLLYYAEDRVADAVKTWRRVLELDPSMTQAEQALRQAEAELDFAK